MKNDYIAYKRQKSKKRIIYILLALFIGLNLYVVFIPFKRIYLVEHAYPEAKKWEFMAMSIRKYGYFLAKYSFLNEKDWIIKQFINLDNMLLDKAGQYLPDDELEKHLKIWFLYDSYQAWNHTSPYLYHNTYTIQETRDILDDFWLQLDDLMTLNVESLYYKVEKFKVWVALTFRYIYSINVFWRNDEDRLDSTLYINDKKNHERLIKIYNYNEYIFKYYKEHYPKVYQAYSDKGYNVRAKHALTSLLIPYLIKNKNQYLKGSFCDVKTNQYLKGFIDSRNELLDMRNDPKEDSESLEKRINEEREILINRTCQNINLIRGKTYE